MAPCRHTRAAAGSFYPNPSPDAPMHVGAQDPDARLLASNPAASPSSCARAAPLYPTPVHRMCSHPTQTCRLPPRGVRVYACVNTQVSPAVAHTHRCFADTCPPFPSSAPFLPSPADPAANDPRRQYCAEPPAGPNKKNLNRAHEMSLSECPGGT
jgi:hypothetical protein